MRIRYANLALLTVLIACLPATLFAQKEARAEQLVRSGIEKYEAGEIERAAKDFERAAKADRRAADPHFYLGRCRLVQNQPKRAEKEFNKALKRDPSHAEARLWLQLAKDIGALQLPFEGLVQDDDSALARKIEAFLKGGGTWERAVDALVFRYDNAYVQGRLATGAAQGFIQREAWDDALAWLETWERKRPALGLSLLTHKGRVFLESGRRSEAERLYALFRENFAADPDPMARQLNGGFIEQMGGMIRQPEILHRTIPRYPEMAIVDKAEGRVYIEAVIGIDGVISDQEVVAGIHPSLDARALEALREWRFQPGELFHRPVRWLALIEVSFNLR